MDVYSSGKNWLARGSFSPKSQILVRLLTYDSGEQIDSLFWRKRIEAALSYRKGLGAHAGNTAQRLIFSESDGIPGVIADRYGDFLVCQFLSAGAEFWRDEIVRILRELWPCEGIFERSDTDSRIKEGYLARVITLAGVSPPSRISILENDLTFSVDVYQGHKTGFYLDQSINRRIVSELSEGRDVLNAFSYTGGFGVAAAKGGAVNVVNVDSSAEALELARVNFEQNQIRPDGIEYLCADVFTLLRKFRDSRRQFDLIILDPPKFIASAGQLSTGSRGYKDINLLAFKLLRPGGLLITFSCSGYMKPDLFQKIVADAAVDAARTARIMQYLSQAPDHPVPLNFPEALYLKGLVCVVD